MRGPVAITLTPALSPKGEGGTAVIARTPAVSSREREGLCLELCDVLDDLVKSTGDLVDGLRGAEHYRLA